MHIHKRVFVVGCPRSGTTLVQSMLAAHPEVTSFPETHFFNHVRRLRLRGLRPRFRPGSERETLERLLGVLDRPDLVARLPGRTAGRRRWTKALVEALDTVALDRGASVWVEKTPSHLHHLGVILAEVPDVHVLHVLRSGRDVVASMVEAARDHPEAWGGVRTARDCARRWLRDLRLTELHAGNPRHTVVCYDRLVREPEDGSAALCRALDLTPSEAMTREFGRSAEGLVGADEAWKQNVFGELRRTPSDKFETVLTPDDRSRVTSLLKDADRRVEALCA